MTEDRAISLNAVIKAVDKHTNDDGTLDDDISCILEDIPSAEPKTGHWITKDDKEQGYDIGGVKTWYIRIMCSECGFIKTAIEGHTGQYNYCPNCGVRMVEPQEISDHNLKMWEEIYAEEKRRERSE